MVRTSGRKSPGLRGSAIEAAVLTAATFELVLSCEKSAPTEYFRTTSGLEFTSEAASLCGTHDAVSIEATGENDRTETMSCISSQKKEKGGVTSMILNETSKYGDFSTRSNGKLGKAGHKHMRGNVKSVYVTFTLRWRSVERR
ncbi:hypothetical protein F2P81_018184 [Scophthalmus maximus]|uniref:Uncharacterized protein n=1 Tax=Scophthalmus maximus TaxID=52904 RepID=A0A6A4S945_SCOMX|nr:hypothetical protein F2P81_018184 [Scophthalmus maximus]